jgi:hypothetical protein
MQHIMTEYAALIMEKEERPEATIGPEGAQSVPARREETDGSYPG